jgi:hypothetical protein
MLDAALSPVCAVQIGPCLRQLLAIGLGDVSELFMLKPRATTIVSLDGGCNC